MQEKFTASKESGKHGLFVRLVGEWEGSSKVWLDPTAEPDESPVRGTMQLLLDGRYLQHEYRGSFSGKPLEGIALYGYNLALEKFQCVWIDSFHTGTDMLYSEGKRADEEAPENEITVLGSYAYVTPEKEEHWGWRTTLQLLSEDEIRITAYNISPDRHEEKATETVYRRAKS